MKPILCSDCFKDFGLREMAKKIGKTNSVVCPHCNSKTGAAVWRATQNLALSGFKLSPWPSEVQV